MIYHDSGPAQCKLHKDKVCQVDMEGRDWSEP